MTRLFQKARRDLKAFKDKKDRPAENVCKAIKPRKTFVSPRSAVFLAAALSLFALSSCQALKRAAAPVLVFDQRICERPPDGQNGGGQDSGGQGLGVEFTAVNLCGRPVKSVTFRAIVSQKEGGEGGGTGDGGDALDLAFYEAFWTLDGGFDAGEERTIFVPLEDAPPDCEADGLEIESVFMESAFFEDGGWWRRKN